MTFSATPFRSNGTWGALTRDTGDTIRVESVATLRVTTKAGKSWEGTYQAQRSVGNDTFWQKARTR